MIVKLINASGGFKKMIDNPLENQVMETYDNLYVNEKFEEHCSDRARELAKDNNLNPDYYDPFIEILY